MTTIAWDGKTLAADKRAVNCGLCRSITKIFKLTDGSLFAGSGDSAFILQMRAWVEGGCVIAEFPAHQRDKDDWQVCIVIDHDGLRLYERTPYPLRFDDTMYACGSGRDFAIAAMHLGKTAREAVEVACLFDAGSGNGIDMLEL